MIAIDEQSDSFDREWELASHLRRRFGRYELIGKLGSGGMANVYLARAAGPGGFTKLVAVKCIHPHLADDSQFIDMFLDEARIAACIDHPNVCSAFDFGEIDGVYFLAMDYLVGEPWSEILRALHDPGHGRSAPERHAFVARICADAAEGLHAAHEAIGSDGAPLEVVHRDVAPPNLFLRYDGQVQVVDFGCAKAAKRLFRTEYGKVRGHIAYVAPELLQGKEADRRADVWSLGVVAWELLTGVRLFRRSSLTDTMFAVARDEVRPPSEVAPSVPEELDGIVLRALSRDPDTRYATARELSEALGAYARASGAPSGLRYLSGWMDALFPGGRSRSARILDTVREVSEIPSRPRLQNPRLRMAAELPTLRDDRVREDEAPTRLVGPTPRHSGLRALASWRRMRPRTWLTAAAIVLALGAGSFLDEIGFGGTGSTTGASAIVPRAPHRVVREPMRPPAIEPGAVSRPAVVDRPPEVEGRPEAPAATAPPAVQYGRVNVITPNGWANVAEGDRVLGPTPGQFTLPAGRHRLRIVPGGGGAPEIVWVTIRPGRVSRIVHELR